MPNRKARGTLGCAVLLLLVATAAADDWPQFLGPGRDGVYRGTIGTDWPDGKPPLLWSKKVGQGFAGPVVAGERVILFHRVGDDEVLEALEARDGAPIWRYEYPTRYRDDFGFDEGPRSAPAVSASVVYTFGAEGVLSAVELEAGTLRWSVDTRERFSVPKGFFGAAGTPLVDGGRVLLNVGGAGAGIVAFDAASGKLLWNVTHDEASYSSPVEATFGAENVALFHTREGLVVVDSESGEVKHRFRWRSRSRASVNAAVPLVVGDVIFLSASYGTGAVALRYQDAGLEKLWSSDESLSSHYATSVHRDSVLYGFHGRQEYSPSLRAVELMTGKVLWSVDRFGAGTVTLARDKLIIVHEKGELIVASASPERFQVHVRAPLLPGTIRAHPAIAEGVLYVRNENTLAAFDLGAR